MPEKPDISVGLMRMENGFKKNIGIFCFYLIINLIL